MLGKDKLCFVHSQKRCIFPLLYVVDFGIFRTKLRSLRVSGTLAYRLLT